jgi:uncharacterized protein YcbK (DUF882 family)
MQRFPNCRLPVTAKPRGNIDYSDPVGGGRVPLADLRGRFEDRLTPHFKVKEFAAHRIGTRKGYVPYARISRKLVEGLEGVRTRIDAPIEVIEAYRYPALNRARRGARRSQHMTGRAASIRAKEISPERLAEAVREVMGPTVAIGVGADRIHVDVRGARLEWTEDGGSRTHSVPRSGSLRFPRCELPIIADVAGYGDPVTGGAVPLLDARGKEHLQLSEHFSVSEFLSKSPIGGQPQTYARISPELIASLQELRESIGRTITVTSGYRSPAYNQSIGGVTKSQHMTGRAADIVAAGMTPRELARHVVAVFGPDIGLGVYQGSRLNFVHVDIRGQAVRWSQHS